MEDLKESKKFESNFEQRRQCKKRKKIIENQLPGLQKNVLLAPFTTFQIGGAAQYFFIAKTREDIIKAIRWAEKEKLPFFILGGGSNLLVADEGYDGLVIKIENREWKIQSDNTRFKIICEPGVWLAKLVSKSQELGITGLEWAVGIPGTVGGAIRGNAGAFGFSISEIVKSVEVLEVSLSQINKNQNFNSKFKIKSFKNSKCQFQYRDSIFKRNPDLIILSVEFELKRDNQGEIQKRIREFFAYRKQTQPLNLPSAGSIFKNLKLKNISAELLRELPEIKEFQKKGMIPAGFLIEKAGLKGKKIGKAQISTKNANFIVNLGKAYAKDVLSLIALAKEKVKEKFDMILEEEIEYLGIDQKRIFKRF